ncbi:MAG: SRPBCC domain-containing protein [Bryobacteraceae bacterium]
MTLEDLTLDTTQSIDINADIGAVFRSLLHRFGEGFTKPPGGESMQMVLEQWPGGRWFRDRGNGIGHLWGHVQVIKPPVLLELSGPMFMSYPALNHIELKLEQLPGGTRVDLRHRAIGLLDGAHREGVSGGWRHILDNIARDCSARAGAQRG